LAVLNRLTALGLIEEDASALLRTNTSFSVASNRSCAASRTPAFQEFPSVIANNNTWPNASGLPPPLIF